MAAAAVTPVAERGFAHQGGSEKTLPHHEYEDRERQNPEHCVPLPAGVHAGGVCGWVLGHGKSSPAPARPENGPTGQSDLLDGRLEAVDE
jgi:hypothetical protein